MAVSDELARAVRARAAARCQYCLMHESLQGATFHIEHVIPKSKGGESELRNLVLACPGCNLHKSNRTFVLDRQTGTRIRLFHPVDQVWSDHFHFVGYEIIGLTATGRGTIDALDLNAVRRRRIREVEAAFGLFPPS